MLRNIGFNVIYIQIHSTKKRDFGIVNTISSKKNIIINNIDLRLNKIEANELEIKLRQEYEKSYIILQDEKHRNRVIWLRKEIVEEKIKNFNNDNGTI